LLQIEYIQTGLTDGYNGFSDSKACKHRWLILKGHQVGFLGDESVEMNACYPEYNSDMLKMWNTSSYEMIPYQMHTKTF
jgi:hypothetical protein